MPARALKANEFDGVLADLLGTCGHTGVWCALVTSIRSDTTVGVDNVPLRQNGVPMFPSGPTPSFVFWTTPPVLVDEDQKPCKDH
jgi:hypothetical protein